LTENIVQAASRDILAYMVGQLVARGLDIRLHIHDEIVCLADEAAAEETQRTMLSIMSSAPAWMTNLPVAAESEITKLYKK
jgi:DNA polymerase I-like protein with 3'-5' exonuclease and polymerase domains